jgi:hypothetical protein
MKNGVLAPFFPPAPSEPGRHSYQPSIGTRHRLVLAEARNAAEVVTVSARALISSGPLVSGVPSALAFTHGGTSPHRIERTRRVDSSSGSACRLTTELIVVVGATLKFGCDGSLDSVAAMVSSIALIFSASSAGSVVTANRPHMYPMVAEGGDKAGWTA